MKKSKSSLFLMELIVVIFFFALTSAVCLQIFVQAHNYSKMTDELNDAILCCENVGEIFYEYKEDAKPVLEDIIKDVPEGYVVNLKFFDDGINRILGYSYVRQEDDYEVYSFTFNQHIKEVAE